LPSETVEVLKRVDKDYVVVSSSTGGVQRILARHVVVDGGFELDLALMLSDLELGKLTTLSLRKLRLSSELYLRIIDAVPLCISKRTPTHPSNLEHTRTGAMHILPLSVC
jgi:hypothetical protein